MFTDNTIVAVAITFGLLACSSSAPPDDAGTDASVKDSAPSDVSTQPEAEASVCAPPQGTTCPPTQGNCKHIGDPCTKGGGQCVAPTSCDLDLDPGGAGICITYLACTPNNHDCGSGATCCNTAMTSNVAVCLPNACLPSDCQPEN